MLWIEKYRPRSFSEITTHGEIVRMLSAYTIESVPNLIFYGQTGYNKKTLLYSMIAHLYGTRPEPKQKTVEMKVNSNTLVVSYLESDEVIEISPSEHGVRDRHVVQNIIKDMAQTRPILSMFGAKKRSVKILVIDEAENLSRDAQAALRRTMEIYSDHFRIFMVCSEISRLMEPIRSRALFVRTRGFSNEEIVAICAAVLEKENYTVDRATLGEIAENAGGNCKRALCVLEVYCLNRDEEHGNKRHRTDVANFRLDWEAKIDSIVGLIKNKPKPDNFQHIRKEFYSLLTSCISPNVILLEMTRQLCRAGFDISRGIADLALVYDERLKLGTKHLLHLEAFAASAMCLYSQAKNQ